MESVRKQWTEKDLLVVEVLKENIQVEPWLKEEILTQRKDLLMTN